jgi:hypothetical protein
LQCGGVDLRCVCWAWAGGNQESPNPTSTPDPCNNAHWQEKSALFEELAFVLPETRSSASNATEPFLKRLVDGDPVRLADIVARAI